MIPRPIDLPPPPPPPERAPVVTDTIQATVIDIAFPHNAITLTLFDGDSYELAGDVILVEYATNPRLGRFAEKFMIFRAHAYFITERQVMMEVPREPFKPTGEVSQLVPVVPDADDPVAS